MTGSDGLPALPFESSRAWRAWLEENHDSADEVWLKIAKKSSGLASVTFDQALDEALCFGWIDVKKRGLDEQWYALRFTPRRPGSSWSRTNRERIERLLADGKVHPAGRREVDRAREAGLWGTG